jgi:rhodanese-related sulfurtransferase
MGFLDGLRRAFGRGQGGTPAQNSSAARRPAEEEEDPRVPEVTAQELLAELRDGANGNLLLDCREHYERAQSFIPNSIHIPMNSIPGRLAELDPARDVVVYCAHGNRSYGVAGWLNQQGYTARSLKGGIVEWQHRGGKVESPPRSRS